MKPLDVGKMLVKSFKATGIGQPSQKSAFWLFFNITFDISRTKLIPMKKPLKGGFFAAPISTTAKEYLVKNILEQQKSLAHKEQ